VDCYRIVLPASFFAEESRCSWIAALQADARSSNSLGQASNPHRFFVGSTDFNRLARLEWITVGELLAKDRMLEQFFETQSINVCAAMRDRQRNGFIHFRITNHSLGILALRDALEIIEESLSKHQNPAIALPEMFLSPVGDSSLPGPGNEILIHDVACYP